jgi:hypothetical protein
MDKAIALFILHQRCALSPHSNDHFATDKHTVTTQSQHSHTRQTIHGNQRPRRTLAAARCVGNRLGLKHIHTASPVHGQPTPK